MPDMEETPMNIRSITFSSGDYQLKGTLHLPANTANPPVVIGCHGLFSQANSPKQAALAEKCVALGIAYFRFDHRGCGESTGVFGEVTSLDGRRKDLQAAVTAVREMNETGKLLGLFGSSFGGAVVLSAARESDAAAIVTYATPLSGTKIVEMLENEEDPSTHPAIDPDRLHFDISEKIDGVANILMIHGDSDKVVSPSEAHRLYGKAKMPKRLIFLKDGDHAMSLVENQEKFVREASLWFKAALKSSGQPN